MIDRRKFVKTLGAATGAVAIGLPPINADAENKPNRLERVGLQLYTVRREMERDFDGTLQAVAEIGYKDVEFAGYFGRTPADVRATLDRLGLEAPSAHVGTSALTKDWEKTIDSGKVMGHKYLIVASINANERLTLDDYRRHADLFNTAGETARNAGMRLGYHNHAFEFIRLDGKLPYDLLLERTDPKLVAMEMDLFWITKGGRNPLEYFSRYPGRFEAVHVKDMDGSPQQRMVDVGRGRIDFARIFAQRKKGGIRYFFVEHDDPQPSAIESVKTSYQYLKRLKF